MKSLHPKLNPEAIFERGFVTTEETHAVDLGKFGSKINLEDEDGEREGIWIAFITEEDRELYHGNTTGETVRGVLLNHALCFTPNPTWGRVLIGKTNGDQRPIFKRADQLEHLMATHDEYLKVFEAATREKVTGEEATEGEEECKSSSPSKEKSD